MASLQLLARDLKAGDQVTAGLPAATTVTSRRLVTKGTELVVRVVTTTLGTLDLDDGLKLTVTRPSVPGGDQPDPATPVLVRDLAAAVPANLPARLSDTALRAAYASWLLSDLANPTSDVYRALTSKFGGSASVDWSTVDLYGFGHSYVAGTGASTTANRFISQLDTLLGTATLYNRGVSGASMAQTVHAIATGIGGVTPWTAGTKGLAVLDSVLNDVLHTTSATEPKDATGFAQATRTALRLLRAGGIFAADHASLNYAGSSSVWSSFADPAALGGNARVGASGASVTIAGYTPTEITVYGFGFAQTTGEPTVAVSVGGTDYGTFTTQDQAGTLAITGKGDTTYSYQLCSWRVTGLPAGSKTVTIRNAGGNSFYFSGYSTPPVAPPSIILVQDAPLLTYSSSPWTKTQGDTYLAARNATVASIAAEPEFGGAMATVVANAATGYDPATMLTGDNLHRNDAGHLALAQAIRTVAATLPVRSGMTP